MKSFWKRFWRNFHFRPKIGWRISIQVKTSSKLLKTCFYNIMSKKLLLESKSLTFFNSVTYLNFTAQLIHAPDISIIFYFYDTNGNLVSSIIRVDLSFDLPNYVSFLSSSQEILFYENFKIIHRSTCHYHQHHWNLVTQSLSMSRATSIQMFRYLQLTQVSLKTFLKTSKIIWNFY